MVDPGRGLPLVSRAFAAGAQRERAGPAGPGWPHIVPRPRMASTARPIVAERKHQAMDDHVLARRRPRKLGQARLGVDRGGAASRHELVKSASSIRQPDAARDSSTKRPLGFFPRAQPATNLAPPPDSDAPSFGRRRSRHWSDAQQATAYGMPQPAFSGNVSIRARMCEPDQPLFADRAGRPHRDRRPSTLKGSAWRRVAVAVIGRRFMNRKPPASRRPLPPSVSIIVQPYWRTFCATNTHAWPVPP